MNRILSTIRPINNKLIAISLAFSCQQAPLCSAEAEQLTIATGNWCPYICDVASRPHGYVVDLLTAVYVDTDIKISYVEMPWQQSLRSVKAGQYDAVIGAYKTDGKGLLFPKHPFTKSYNCFFTSAQNTWQFSGIDSLIDQKLGVSEGYSYGLNIDRFIADTKDSHTLVASGSSPLSELLQALNEGKISVIIDDYLVFRYTRQTLQPDIETRRAGCQYPASAFIAFTPNSAKSQRLANQFDAGLSTLKESAKYRAIKKKYGLNKP